MRMPTRWIPCSALALLLWGCNVPVFVDENRPLEALQPAGTMPGDDVMYSDTDLFVVPIRKPTAKEAAKLVEQQTKLGLPMPVPWVGERDLDLEILWTMKNLETTPIGANVVVDGGNEFGDYDKALYGDPTAAAADQPVLPDVMGSLQLVNIEAGGTRSGIFREDQLREAGLDLEVITRYPPAGGGTNTPFIVLERNSTASTVGLDGIPKGDVTPAMVRIRIFFRATGHAVLDYSVRVREKGTPGDKLAQKDATDLYVSTDSTLAPPVTPMPVDSGT
ncbi:MAG: hypothetical protein ABI321_06420 [Polyangia bacterium]